MDVKKAFVKQCADVPELSVDLNVEDVGYIRKINDKGKVPKFQGHFHSLLKRNEIYNKDSFLENTNKYSCILISLIVKDVDKKLEKCSPN